MHTYRDVTLNVASTPCSVLSSSAYLAADTGEVNLLYQDKNSSFPAVFDTGAILGISFNKSDFVGSIRALINHTLGVLVNGLDVSGVGALKWKFRTKTYILALKFFAYYIPKARDRPINPHRLFNATRGVNGGLIAGEDKATLAFYDVGEIVVNYDPNNHLNIEMGKNHISGAAEVNTVGMLDESNITFSPASKRLLH